MANYSSSTAATIAVAVTSDRLELLEPLTCVALITETSKQHDHTRNHGLHGLAPESPSFSNEASRRTSSPQTHLCAALFVDVGAKHVASLILGKKKIQRMQEEDLEEVTS